MYFKEYGIKDVNGTIEQGRRYAYGIGTLIDIEKAYECWKDLERYLSDEDRQVFHIISDLVGDSEGVSSIEKASFLAWGNSFAFSDYGVEKIACPSKKRTDISENEVESLFNYLLLCAKDNDKLNELYKVLKAFEDKEIKNNRVSGNRDSNPSVKRFCNVFAYYVWRFFGQGNSNGVQTVLDGINKIRRDKKKSEISYQAIFNVYRGKNGMNLQNRIYFVELINETNKRKHLLKNDITVEDLDKSLAETMELFKEAEKDATVEERLRQEQA